MADPYYLQSDGGLQADYNKSFKLRREQFPRENESESHYWVCTERIKALYRPKVTRDANTLEFCERLARRAIQHSPSMKGKLKRQLGIVPGSTGYRCLLSILENSGRYYEAMAIAEEAKTEGWGGQNWESVLKRLRKKSEESASSKNESNASVDVGHLPVHGTFPIASSPTSESGKFPDSDDTNTSVEVSQKTLGTDEPAALMDDYCKDDQAYRHLAIEKSSPETDATAQPKKVTFVCGPCKRSFRVAEEFHGRNGKCPACGGLLSETVQEVAERPETSMGNCAAISPLPEPPKPIAPSKSPPNAFHSPVGCGCLTLVVVMLLIGFLTTKNTPSVEPSPAAKVPAAAFAPQKAQPVQVMDGNDCGVLEKSDTLDFSKQYSVLRVDDISTTDRSRFIIWISAPEAASSVEKIVTCFSAAVAGWQTLRAGMCDARIVTGTSMVAEYTATFAADGRGTSGKDGEYRVDFYPGGTVIPCLKRVLDRDVPLFSRVNPEIAARCVRKPM